MKKAITIIRIIFIGALFLAGYLIILSMHKDALARMHDNLLQSVSKNNAVMYKFTKKEFKQYIANSNNELFKKITDSLKIKPKEIIRTTNNKYYYNYGDTVINSVKENDSIYSAEYIPDSCARIQVSFNSETEEFIFGDWIFDYESQSVIFKRRETKNGKKIFWPFGKLKFKSVTENKCSGETITEEIEITKRNGK